jgi:hypothetical protein
MQFEVYWSSVVEDRPGGWSSVEPVLLRIPSPEHNPDFAPSAMSSRSARGFPPFYLDDSSLACLINVDNGVRAGNRKMLDRCAGGMELRLRRDNGSVHNSWPRDAPAPTDTVRTYWETAGLGFAEHIVQFTNQLIRSVRLAYEAAVIGNFSLSGL